MHPTDLLQRLVAGGQLTPIEARELASLEPARLLALLRARGLLPSERLVPSFGNSPPPGPPRQDLVLSADVHSPSQPPGQAPPIGDSGRLPAGERRTLGRYQLLEELGRGGMGVVWRARDPQLRREVAVKMLLGDASDSPEVLARRRERFLREGRAAARLRHPHVVGLHEVGEEGGRPFMVMDLVRGGSLEAALGQEGRLPPRRAAEVVRDVALALEHAHGQGIVHRDVKPGNVLLEEGTGRALLSDFGLARDVTGAERVDLSHSGQLIGTPDYLSPEQVRGERQIGPAVDVWALGGVLYKALTGEVPFPSETLGQLMHAVLDREPVPPRALDPQLHPDLETIALKCLEKDTAARYGSAGEVAAELNRFLQGEALAARPLGRRERALRWARRNRALALTLLVSGGLVLGLCLLGLVGAVVSVQRIRSERDRAEAARRSAEEARTRAEAEGQRASAAEAEARAAAERTAAEAAAKGELLARALLERGDRFREEGRYHPAAALYAASLAHAESLGARSGLVAALSHAPRALRLTSPLVVTTALLSDGRCLASGTRGLLHSDRVGERGFTGEVWGRQGEVEVTCGAVAPGGEVAGLADAQGNVRQVRLSDGEELARWKAGDVALPASALAWSPDGQELVVARRGLPELLRWTREGLALRPLPAPAGVLCLAWSPDGKTLLAGLADGLVLALDPSLLSAPRPLDRHRGPVVGVGWCQGRAVSASPQDGLLAHAAPDQPPLRLACPGVSALCVDGPWVTVGTHQGELIQWRPGAQGQAGERRGPFTPRILAPITALASQEEGRLLLVATRRGGLELIAAPGGEVLDSKLMLSGSAVSAVHPGDRMLSVGGLQGPGGGESLWSLTRRPGSGLSISSQPEAAELLRSWSADGRATLVVGVEARVEREGAPPVRLSGPGVLRPFLSPDGGRAWAACVDGSLRVWDARSGLELERPVQPGQPLVVASSAQGRWLAALDPAGPTLTLFDTTSGEVRARWRNPGRFEALAVHPSGKAVISAAGSQPYLLPVDTERAGQPLPAARARISALTCAPDGQLLAIGTAAGEVELWSLDALPTRQQVLSGLASAPTTLAFTPDGDQLLAASDEGEVLLWDLTRFHGVMTEKLPAHVNAVCFDPAAPRLFVGLISGHVILLDWERGQGYTLAPEEKQPAPLYRLRASPDGAWLACVPLEGPVSLWQVPRGGEPRRAATFPPARDADWSPEGVLFLVGLDRRLLVSSPPGTPPRELLPARPGTAALSLTCGEAGLLAMGTRGALLLLDTRGGELRQVGIGHQLLPDYLAALPGGELLVAASDRFTSVGRGGAAPQAGLDPEDRFDLRRLGRDGRRELLMHGSGRLHALSVTRDGRRAVAAGSGVAHVWDLTSGQQVLRVEQRAEAPLLGAELAQARSALPAGLDAPVYPAALSPGGEVLASGWPLRRVRLWFLADLGALDEGAQAAARVEALSGFRAQGVEALAVDTPLDDPRWRRAGR